MRISRVSWTRLLCVRIRTPLAGGADQKNDIGRSRGGWSTKVHAVVDLRGRPLEILITPGQQHDCTVADRLIDELKQRGIKAVIPSGVERTKKRRYDRALYRLRYRIECFFHDLKRYRRIASRYDCSGSRARLARTVRRPGPRPYR
jgi:transposase